MATRLEILKASLVKKNARLNASFDTHFTDVKSANGQPLNDKRNGHVTLNKWERQSDSIRNHMADIEKTERAIEFEENKIRSCEYALKDMPPQIIELVESGTLIQWRKHPTTFFIEGVDKARISYKKGVLTHKYSGSIPDKDQFGKFRDTFNGLNKSLKAA